MTEKLSGPAKVRLQFLTLLEPKLIAASFAFDVMPGPVGQLGTPSPMEDTEGLTEPLPFEIYKWKEHLLISLL